MQFQADILDRAIVRPRCLETTALGAAALAGLTAGVWKTGSEAARPAVDRRFEPDMAPQVRQSLLKGWEKAVSRAGSWTED